MLAVMSYRDPPALTIRPATLADTERLELLAELDEDALPPSPVLLGFVGGELWAALSLTSGAVIADPFRPSADVVTLLARRARQLNEPPRRRRFAFKRTGHGDPRAVGFELKTS
jgi:hypothetical protein